MGVMGRPPSRLHPASAQAGGADLRRRDPSSSSVGARRQGSNRRRASSAGRNTLFPRARALGLGREAPISEPSGTTPRRRPPTDPPARRKSSLHFLTVAI